MGCRDGGPEKKPFNKRDNTPPECYLIYTDSTTSSPSFHFDKEWAMQLCQEYGWLMIGPIPVVTDYRP